jgi:hypothetical protein
LHSGSLNFDDYDSRARGVQQELYPFRFCNAQPLSGQLLKTSKYGATLMPITALLVEDDPELLALMEAVA